MTAPARITQAEIERAAKAARKAGWASARLTIDLAKERIEVFLSDSPEAAASGNEWDKELE